MIIDKQAEFSDAQALAATAASTNVIDLGTDSNFGDGEPMCVVLTVDVAADHTTGDETYEIKLQTDDDNAFGAAVDLTDQVIAAATLSLNARLVIDVPELTAIKQYLRLYYILGGTTPSVTVSAHLVPRSFVDKQRTYKSGSTISG